MERADGPKRPSASQSDPSGIVVVAAGVLAQDLGGSKLRFDGDFAGMRARYRCAPLYTGGRFHVMPIRTIIAIITVPSYGITAPTCLIVPALYAGVDASGHTTKRSSRIRHRRPRSKIRANYLEGTLILRPHPDAMQGANKHYGSYIFFHGSIGFLVFSSFVVG